MSTASEETEVVETEDEAEVVEKAGSEEEVEVSGDTEAEDLVVAEAEEETPEPAETPERSEQAQEQEGGTPFSFRVSGRDVAVEGAGFFEHEDADGNPTASVIIPRDSWLRQVQPYLQDASAIAKHEQELQAQIEALDPKANETVVRAQTLIDNFEKIIASEESLTEFLANFDQNKRVWELEANLAARDAQDGLRTTREETQNSAEQETEVLTQIDDDISGTAIAIFDSLNLDIGDEAKAVIGEHLWDERTTFYRYATADDVRQHPNVTVGEVVCDYDRIEARIRSMSRLTSAGSGQKTKTEKARKANAAVLDPKDLPATVPATGSPAPGKKVKEYASKEDFEADMGLN